MSAEKPRKRALAGLNPLLEQLRNRLHQRQVWPFGDQGQYPLRIRFQRRDAPPRGFGALLPLSSQRCTHLIAELALMS